MRLSYKNNGIWSTLIWICKDNLFVWTFYFMIYDALHDLVPFAQLKKRENTHGEMFILQLY